MRTIKQIISGCPGKAAGLVRQRELEAEQERFRRNLETIQDSNRVLQSMSEMIVLSGRKRRKH